MFPYLLILFTVVPALELMLLIEVGSHIGSVNTIGLIIVTGIVGAALARYQGFLVIQKIQTSLNSGKIPSSELMDGLMILVGGIVLLTPGFVTDTIGLLLLIPLTRNLIKLLVQGKMEEMIKKGQVVHFQSQKPNNKRFDDIDV